MSLVDELKNKTVFELKSYAKKNNIDIFGANTKAEILETILNFVPLAEFPGNYQQQQEAKEIEDVAEKVAIYSIRNLYWDQVGEIISGYNIVSKEASEKWLTHKAVRLATPEELASYYGKA